MEQIQRIYEIACGALVLVLTGCLGIMLMIIKGYEKQAKMTVKKRCRAYAEKVKKEQTKKGADHFVKLYEANQRIKELERELATERNRNKIMEQAVDGFRVHEVR